MLFRFGFICLLVFVLLWGACCGPNTGQNIVAETEEKHFQRGQRLLREGREDEALNAFLKVIDKRNDGAESHLEAGILYQQHIGDPVTAIYHYRRFIELRPETEEAARVEGLIASAQKDFARNLSGQPFRNDIDRLDLLEIVETARQENTDLRRKISQLEARLAQYESTRISAPPSTANGAPSSPRPSRSPPASTSEERYAVVEGDTLSRISIKVYGTPGRWMEIYDANRDILPNPNALRIGQQLNIPGGRVD